MYEQYVRTVTSKPTTIVGDEMSLPSASYIARCVKPPHSSSDIAPDCHVTQTCGYYHQSNKNRSPEIMSEHVASEYSDAGDTFASRLSNAADEEHDHAVSSGCRDKDNVASRDFILKRFLPAAQAMVTTTDKKGASASTSAPRHADHQRSASLPKCSSSARPGSFEYSASSRSKIRFIREVKQDVPGFSDDEDEERFRACGFPLHLGRLTLLQLRYSLWASRSSSRSKGAPQTVTKKVSEVIQDEASDNSDDLFWSDEEAFDNAVRHSNGEVRSMNERESMRRKGLVAAPPPVRLHSMETVHTPDHRGFLGVPKTSNLSSGEITERARQVDRLGARLTRMLSKTNYMESRSVRVHDDHQNEYCEAAGDHQSSTRGPSTSSSAAQKSTKWVDAVASLRPPPSPKMPSESWLSNTLPPERFLIVKKLSRKPLGSFIPIKPHPVEEESSLRTRQSSSLKEHLHGREILSPTMQAV